MERPIVPSKCCEPKTMEEKTMKNSEFVKELIQRLEENASHMVYGSMIEHDFGTVAVDADELSVALQKVLPALGLGKHMKVTHCTETQYLPKMDNFLFDLNALDQIHVPRKEPVRIGQENAPKRLLYYALMQLPERHDQCFRPLTRPLNQYNKADSSVSLHDYEMVYGGPLTVSVDMTDIEICEMLFAKFNRDDRPNGKTSRSMSVSDIIHMDDDKYYFCDSYGFVPLSASGKAMM